MDTFLYAKYLVVLLFVLGLIGLISYGIRKLGFAPLAEKPKSGKKRLAISQSIGLDSKRRLVLVRRDDKEHLILIGPNSDVVIETDIDAKRASPKSQKATDEADSADDVAQPQPNSEPRLPSLKPVAIKGSEQ
ncbi:flagellar biosynthetic protein FliO [Sneathiella glossodoripedis]|uniref:flagellar biosynthetic protein FliO n=1 Tax=Sneathiella glossodoripedis TaxID=418853 RepID=UPI00046FBE27|nr:flagellar biosynthetic protein FliO [Sneathiella glossodoripedis]